MEEKRKSTEDKIKEIESQLISNCKDTHFAKNLIQQLAGLYQMDKLIDVPLKDVKETIDLGACAIHKVKDGYVFEAKGGMKTHVSLRMQSVCTMLQTLFEAHGDDGRSIAGDVVYSNLCTAIEYIFQAPIFASLNEKALLDIATAILKSFNDYAKENYTNAEAVEETEEDIKANNEFEQMGQAIETLANAPLPPEDTEE